MNVYNNDEDLYKTSYPTESSKDEAVLCRSGWIMERFRNYTGMFIELMLMGIMYLIILPFKVLYSLGNRLVSR